LRGDAPAAFAVAGEDQEITAGKETLVLLKRFSGNPVSDLRYKSDSLQVKSPSMRFAVFCVLLAVCGCTQTIEYPPTGKGWTKLNDAEAARVGPLLARASYYLPVDFNIVIDPVHGTKICDGARALRLDFTGRWRIWTAWPWVGPWGGVGGGQVVIYLREGSSTYYHFYHGPIDIPGGRPDVTIAAASYTPSRFFWENENQPGNPMTAQVRFR
jgi:hypothetical protein